MSQKIVSKTHNYGNENESTWPPRFGTNEGKGFRKVYGEYFEPNNFGQAPMVQFDSMPKTYHEAAGREVESRKEWQRLDKEHGCITFSSQEEAARGTKKGIAEEKQALKDDRRKASLKALQMHRENPKEMRDKLKKTRELQETIAKKEGLDKGINQAVQTSLKGIKK